MLIAVAGGTGTAGRAVVAEALTRGHQVRILSRHRPAELASGVEHSVVDAFSGEGLAGSLSGAAALVDTLDGKFGNAQKSLPGASERLLAAARSAAVPRAVLLSIIGSDLSSYSYYQTQAERASLYLADDIGAVVYATQFHQLVGSIFAAIPGVIPVIAGASFQPVSVESVAVKILDAVEAGPGASGSVELGSGGSAAKVRRVAGPELLSMDELAAQWKAAGNRGVRLRMPLPGEFGRFLRSGKNLALDAAEPGQTFAQWLVARS